MDAKNIKELASNHTFEELQEFANKFEETGVAPVKTSEDPGDQMSDYLMAAEVRYFMDEKNLSVQEALREFSKRVRGVLV
jgi:hypothetical protein